MKRYMLSHLSDDALLRDLATVVVRERTATAEVLAHIAEVDARKLFLPAAYPSMFAYCVGELRFSEEAAFKRIHAARAARRFPAIFDAVADGRLHLSAVVMLAPHLGEQTVDELLAAATHRTKADIELLLAERFPRPDVPTRLQEIPTVQHAPGRVGEDLPLASEGVGPVLQHAPGRADQLPGPAQVPFAAAPVDDRAQVKPLAPQRFAVQFTMGQTAHDKLRYAQELLGHEIPAGDLAQIFERALDALIPELEQRKFAATARPRPGRPRSRDNERYVPAQVRRAVWERDQGQCTFVSENGHRCSERKFVEFDHVQEVARGGEASIAGIQLRCRAHNQYQAECTFGSEFMRHKRIGAAEARAETKVRTAAANRARDASAHPTSAAGQCVGRG